MLALRMVSDGLLGSSSQRVLEQHLHGSKNNYDISGYLESPLHIETPYYERRYNGTAPVCNDRHDRDNVTECAIKLSTCATALHEVT